MKALATEPWSPEVVAQGVTKQKSIWHDSYSGSMDALIRAGVMLDGQFPGQAGMRKMRVLIYPNGLVAGGAPQANHRGAREPGGKWIERGAKGTFIVRVMLPIEESELRRAEGRRWEAQLNRAAAQTRGHLRLVWSAPARK